MLRRPPTGLRAAQANHPLPLCRIRGPTVATTRSFGSWLVTQWAHRGLVGPGCRTMLPGQRAAGPDDPSGVERTPAAGTRVSAVCTASGGRQPARLPRFLGILCSPSRREWMGPGGLHGLQIPPQLGRLAASCVPQRSLLNSKVPLSPDQPGRASWPALALLAPIVALPSSERGRSPAWWSRLCTTDPRRTHALNLLIGSLRCIVAPRRTEQPCAAGTVLCLAT